MQVAPKLFLSSCSPCRMSQPRRLPACCQARNICLRLPKSARCRTSLESTGHRKPAESARMKVRALPCSSRSCQNPIQTCCRHLFLSLLPHTLLYIHFYNTSILFFLNFYILHQENAKVPPAGRALRRCAIAPTSSALPAVAASGAAPIANRGK